MTNPHDLAIAMAAVFVGVPLAVAAAAGLMAAAVVLASRK